MFGTNTIPTLPFLPQQADHVGERSVIFRQFGVDIFVATCLKILLLDVEMPGFLVLHGCRASIALMLAAVEVGEDDRWLRYPFLQRNPWVTKRHLHFSICPPFSISRLKMVSMPKTVWPFERSTCTRTRLLTGPFTSLTSAPFR